MRIEVDHVRYLKANHSGDSEHMRNCFVVVVEQRKSVELGAGSVGGGDAVVVSTHSDERN